MDLHEIRELFNNGELYLAIETMDTIDNLKDQPLEFIIDYHILYFDIFLRMGKYEQCVQIGNDLITVSEFTRELDRKIDLQIMEADALWRWNELEKLSRIVNEA